MAGPPATLPACSPPPRLVREQEAAGAPSQAPFFNAANLLERKSLGSFLQELDALSGCAQQQWQGGKGVGGSWRAHPLRRTCALKLSACCTCACLALKRLLNAALAPPTPGCRPLAGPAKPPELVRFSTNDSVGHAMRVRPSCCHGARATWEGRMCSQSRTRSEFAPSTCCSLPCPAIQVGQTALCCCSTLCPLGVFTSVPPHPAPCAPQQLAAYNILAAPVSDEATGEYVGMIDTADLLKGLIKGAPLPCPALHGVLPAVPLREATMESNHVASPLPARCRGVPRAAGGGVPQGPQAPLHQRAAVGKSEGEPAPPRPWGEAVSLCAVLRCAEAVGFRVSKAPCSWPRRAQAAPPCRAQHGRPACPASHHLTRTH